MLQQFYGRHRRVIVTFSVIYLAYATFIKYGYLSIQSASLLGLLSFYAIGPKPWEKLKAPLKFIYSCFLKPLGKHDNQQTRLEAFYRDQAEVYDATRGGLLRGRNTMLKLCAAQLRERIKDKSQKSKPLIWIDIGGGTGWNIEKMNDHFPIENFHKVYLVDLCSSLCKVARERFQKRNWNNVVVLCQDALDFVLPGLEKPEGEIGLITMSYSLSMIDSFYPVIDRVSTLLSPDGVFGVADFYVSGKSCAPAEKTTESHNRQTGWFTRFFWQMWFEFDHINLHPARRDYLEYKFGTLKAYNGRNHFIIPWLVRIPYYIWLGVTRSAECKIEPVDSETERDVCCSSSSESSFSADCETPQSVISVPRSSFHYQNKSWRMPYNTSLPCHNQFRSYIYAFTWEDPRADLEVLDLKSDDVMLVITSAGDNVLEYALKAQPKRIHCVDMNPCQNHLLELKLAGISNLRYDDFWRMFGDGKHPHFPNLLDHQLSPALSLQAFQYWKNNSDNFSKSFYKTGYSGIALRVIEWTLKMRNMTREIEKFCHLKTTQEQKATWETSIRSTVLPPWLIPLLDNPVFLWNALGVPKNQANMLMSETNAQQYINDTIEPVVTRSTLSHDNYFYYLCLMRKYSKTSCPSYLTESGFKYLKESNALDSLRLHTDSIINVLRTMSPGTLTKAVLMDHMDWFDETEAENEIQALSKAMAQGGYVLWRSASKKPWYNKLFGKHGFKVEAIAIREKGKSIDRVNMYASFYKGIKL